MLVTLNTSDNLMLADTSSKGNINKVLFLVKGLQHCEPINGNLLLRLVEKIDINSNTVSR